MREDDRLYFRRRAEAELRLAVNATCPKVVEAHYTLAEHYLDRVHGDHGNGKERVGDAR